ncbi:hypothetical protein BDW42DRAFT_185063 [Aspergillus taichungensis]|uniref:Protein kinase domain-containing protein n=1 Tax=Aspergillus taichungensis TaxID=482145 RepID=A0A2J5HXC6_9EURO|nr:hypothetical protein BDW42DRAFT_185063 [Aspergillus taichungensis]
MLTTKPTSRRERSTCHNPTFLLFEVKSHIAPAPTPADFNDCFFNESDWEERRELSPIMQCVKRPLAPGRDGDDIVSLEDMDLLSAGVNHETQIFTVRLLETTLRSLPAKGTKLVAKQYDPHYYDDEVGALDPFDCLDWDYKHEVEAYAILRDLQEHTRTVRMILIEHNPGLIMEDANPEFSDQSIRKDMMRSTVDLESELHGQNVSIMSLGPRKITLTSPTSDQPQVMFVDLAATFVWPEPRSSCRITNEPYCGRVHPTDAAMERNSPSTTPVFRLDRLGLDAWVDAEFVHTVAGITVEMRELYSDD